MRERRRKRRRRTNEGRFDFPEENSTGFIADFLRENVCWLRWNYICLTDLSKNEICESQTEPLYVGKASNYKKGMEIPCLKTRT